jgi:hypothetical protein
MPVFTYSAEDVARTSLVKETVWVPCLIEKHTEKTVNNPNKPERNGVTNHIIQLKVEDGEYKGLVMNATFPEDYPGIAFPFLTAMGEDLKKEGGSINFDDYKGRRVLVCVEPGEYNGKPTNNIKSYRDINWSGGEE